MLHASTEMNASTEIKGLLSHILKKIEKKIHLLYSKINSQQAPNIKWYLQITKKARKKYHGFCYLYYFIMIRFQIENIVQMKVII